MDTGDDGDDGWWFVRGALELGGDRGRRRSDTRYGNLDSQCDISVVVLNFKWYNDLV